MPFVMLDRQEPNITEKNVEWSNFQHKSDVFEIILLPDLSGMEISFRI
jgi:hypothetical protein